MLKSYSNFFILPIEPKCDGKIWRTIYKYVLCVDYYYKDVISKNENHCEFTNLYRRWDTLYWNHHWRHTHTRNMPFLRHIWVYLQKSLLVFFCENKRTTEFGAWQKGSRCMCVLYVLSMYIVHISTKHDESTKSQNKKKDEKQNLFSINHYVIFGISSLSIVPCGSVLLDKFCSLYLPSLCIFRLPFIFICMWIVYMWISEWFWFRV